MDRRVFFNQLGLGSAGLLLGSSWLSSCSFGENGDNGSAIGIGGILPIAYSIDCSRLLIEAEGLEEPYSSLVKGDINLRIPGNLSRLGSSVPFGDAPMTEYLAELKAAWDPGEPAAMMKTSLAMGWIMVQPLRKSMSQVYKKLISQGYHYDTINRYYDVFMLKQLSGDPEVAVSSAEDVEHFFRALVPRMITRLHTLKPDYQDGPGWVVRMSEWRKENLNLAKSYAEMYVQDDEELNKHLIRRYNIYDPSDKLIRLLREGNAGSAQKTFLSDPGNSVYSKSLVKGYTNAQALTNYLAGNSGLEEVKALL
jgi:hypothetical protein